MWFKDSVPDFIYLFFFRLCNRQQGHLEFYLLRTVFLPDATPGSSLAFANKLKWVVPLNSKNNKKPYKPKRLFRSPLKAATLEAICVYTMKTHQQSLPRSPHLPLDMHCLFLNTPVFLIFLLKSMIKPLIKFQLWFISDLSWNPSLWWSQ